MISDIHEDATKCYLLQEGDLVWIEHGPNEYSLAIVHRLIKTEQQRGKGAVDGSLTL